MNDMEDKLDNLRQQIKDKKKQIEILQGDIQELEMDIERSLPERFAGILKKANTLLGRYYLYYNDSFNEFNFCYCKKVTKIDNGVEIELGSRIIVNECFNMMVYYENPNVLSITPENNYLNYAIQLNGEQAYQVQDEINKTSSREQSVKDLHSFLRDMYNTNIYNNID